MRRLFFLFLFLLSLFLQGCGQDWEKKFIRKRAEKPGIVQFEVRQASRPYPDLYREHFNLWKNWHRQLIEDLGRNRKRELHDAREARRHLEGLAKYLKSPESDRAKEFVSQFDRVTNPLYARSYAATDAGIVGRRLEGLLVKIDRSLHYKKMKPHFLPTPIPMDLAKYDGEEPLPLETPSIKPAEESADSLKDGSGAISYEKFRELPAS